MFRRLIVAIIPIFFSWSFVHAAQVRAVETKDGWRLLVDERPYFVRGVDYRVSKVGQSPDQGTHEDWAYYDYDGNGRNDAAYDAWLDSNRNDRRDSNEKSFGDFALMKAMGVNTIRWYVNDFRDQRSNKKLLRDLFENYGIRVAVGSKFGAYTIDSGASWSEGTDYRDLEQRKRLLDSIRRMVEEHKDEPYTLLWLLGNENNLRFTNTNAGRYPAAYADLLEEAARLIHGLDGKHPVALVNGDTSLLLVYKRYCPSVDIFGVNAYRGPKGFGGLWEEVKEILGKPVVITEYGGSYAPGSDEDAQSDYHLGCWRDIAANAAGRDGADNSLGGFAFEWLDEWWKAGDPKAQTQPGSRDGRVGVDTPRWSQEYSGIASQGDGKHSPFLRRLRKVYFSYQRAWNGKKEE